MMTGRNLHIGAPKGYIYF